MRNIIVKSVLAVFLSVLLIPTVQAAEFETDIFIGGDFKRFAIQTEHFQLEFDQIIKVQPDEDSDGIPDIVEEIAEYAEYSWDEEVVELGFAAPVSGNDRVAIVLDHNYQYLSEGMAGATTVAYDGTIYFAIDPWMSDDLLKVTVAHEFLHCIQFAYDYYFASTYWDINFAEATAVWVEDILYDYVNDYTYYLPGYFDYTDYSIFASYEDQSYTYSLNIWPRFLNEYYNETDVIVDITEEYFDLESVGALGSLTVYTATEGEISDRGDDIDDVYQDFTVWNLAHDQMYDEGSSYPDVDVMETWSSYPVTGQSPDAAKWPALYGANYIKFNVGSGEDFRFGLTKIEDAPMGITFVPQYSNGAFDTNAVEKNILNSENNYGEYILEGAGDYSAIYVIVSPLGLDYTSGADIFDMGYTYLYSAEYGDFEDEEEVTGEVEVEVSNGDSEKEFESDYEYVRGSQDLNLEVLTFDDDSVTLDWNRVVELDVDYYVVNYGTESGVYNYEKEVSNAWTTTSTISDLSSDTVYYFLLDAYDESGSLIESSEEIAGYTEAFSFTDVMSTDEFYDAVVGLYEENILQGYDDGSFRPDNTINRAELLKVLVEGIGITPDSDEYRDCFTDVADDWYAPYVCYAKEEGWISGYDDGSFKPANEVNKVEALKMMLMVFGYDLDENDDSGSLPYTDTWPTAWYAVYVEKAYDLGILFEEEGEDFNPGAARTRGEISMELWALIGVSN